MYPFEPQLSIQGEFHGKSALSVCSNGAFEETDKANFLIGGGSVGSTRYKAFRFRTIVFLFFVVATTYRSSVAAATAAVLVHEGPSPDLLMLRTVLLSYLPP